MINPLTFFKGASTQFQLALIGLVFIAGFIIGWRVHGWKTDAALYQDLAAIEKTRLSDQKKADKIVDSNEKSKEVIRYVYKNLYKEAEHVSDAGNICFSPESLRMWNRAIEGANNNREKPTPAAETTDQAGATVEQVLKNGADNFEVCALNAQDHNALIDRVEALDGKMCYCAD